MCILLRARFGFWSALAWVVLLLSCGSRAGAAIAITNVSVVNITPSSFSVVCASSVVPSISVFADPGGTSNLVGQVQIEPFPLNTGAPDAANAYERRLTQALLRERSRNQGLVHWRVSLCAPNTTYYFRLQAGDSGGQQVNWPSDGTLWPVRTALENSFVTESRQLVLRLPGLDPSGSIVILSNTETSNQLASVAGDGVASNEVFFSTSDLLATSGTTNYLALGAQEFTATVLGSSSNTVLQTYSLFFTGEFVVGRASNFSLGNFAVLSLGSVVLRAGESATIPVNLYASGITNLAFSLGLPASRFASLSLQPVSSQLDSAVIQPNGPDRFLVSFRPKPGQTLEGNQQIAQFQFATVTNQVSAFVRFVPESLQGLNANGSSVSDFGVSPGRAVIVAKEPLLEGSVAKGGTRNLVLYGIPWAGYQVQVSTNLSDPAAWKNLQRVPMTNLVRTFAGLDTNRVVSFYRAFELAGNPPVLDAELTGTNRTLMVYGRPGTNYTLQSATSLTAPIAWHPVLSYSMTNSFRSLTNIPQGGPAVYYRIANP